MSVTTPGAPVAWRPDVTAVEPQDAIPTALIMQASSVLARVEGDAPSLRVAYVDDDSAAFVPEGDEIPDVAPELSETLVYTAKIARLVSISREQFSQISTPQLLANAVSKAVIRRADEAFLTQAAPVSPAVSPSAGLVNVAGITVGGTVGGTSPNLDAVVQLLADLQDAGSAPSHVVVSPQGYATMRTLKVATDSAMPLLGGTVEAPASTLYGLPVLVAPALPATTGLIIDRSAVVSAVGPLMVAQSEDAFFTRDSIALRVTLRLGWNVVRPERIGTFTIAA